MTRKINRRRFLEAGSASAAAAGFWLTGGNVSESRAAQSPNERLNIAMIGAGGRAGDYNMKTGRFGGSISGFHQENIVALCDVDDNRARSLFNHFNKAPKYKDWRVMLDKQKDIQAVVVSTPDHVHFHASATAIRMGKHVYCEKPLTHSIWEARTLKELAAKHRVATQMGNQGTAGNGLREAAEVLRSGALGDVTEVHLWTNRPIWPQGATALERRMKEGHTVPKTLDWTLWLGPVTDRPYSPVYVPFSWRGWWAFGTGALGDMGCHTMNMPFMGLKLGAPSAVSADVEGGKVDSDAAPVGLTVTYEFPARENFPACRLYWYERRRPNAQILQGIQAGGSGCVIVGSKGRMFSGSDYGDSYRLLPQEAFQGYRPPQPTLPRSPGHHAEWIRACKGGAAAMSNFVDYACGLTETVLLGNLAIRVGQRFTWDSAKLTASIPAAAQYIRRQYRKGWEWTA